jgi:hypothetical protein
MGILLLILGNTYFVSYVRPDLSKQRSENLHIVLSLAFCIALLLKSIVLGLHGKKAALSTAQHRHSQERETSSVKMAPVRTRRNVNDALGLSQPRVTLFIRSFLSDFYTAESLILRAQLFALATKGQRELSQRSLCECPPPKFGNKSVATE